MSSSSAGFGSFAISLHPFFYVDLTLTWTRCAGFWRTGIILINIKRTATLHKILHIKCLIYKIGPDQDVVGLSDLIQTHLVNQFTTFTITVKSIEANSIKIAVEIQPFLC